MSGATLNCNQTSAIYARIRMPRIGLWDAQMKLDSRDTFSSGQSVTITSSDASFSIKGTVIRSGVFDGVTHIRVVAGAAGLAKAVPSKPYQGATLKTIASDLLSAVGETLSSTSDSSALGAVQKFWVRTAGPANVALYRIVEECATAGWRALNDGTIFIGNDTYPAAPGTTFTLKERWFGEGRAVVQSQSPFFLPAQTVTLPGFTGSPQKISVVVHEFQKDSYFAELFFEAS